MPTTCPDQERLRQLLDDAKVLFGTAGELESAPDAAASDKIVSTQLYHEALNQGKRLASFTQTGFYFLLIKLTTHLARAESHDVARERIG